MTSQAGAKVVLASRPQGALKESDLEVVSQDFVEPEPGHVLVASSLLSVDAFIRTTLDEKAYHGSVPIGGTLPAIGVGTVVASNSAKFKVGTRVAGLIGAQSLGPVHESMIERAVKLPGVPESASLGILGFTTGMTAWVGVHAVLPPPKRGEVVVVSAAAGAVGSVAAQFARNCGAKVLGIAGGPEKCAYLTDELHLDGAIDYKDPKRSIETQLDALAPDGVDFFMDQVGGRTLDVVLDRLKPRARVVICGAVSQYQGNLNHGEVDGPSNYLKLAERSATMAGFNVMHYISLLPWMLCRILFAYWRGRVTIKEAHVEGGIHAFPAALVALLDGKHIGKILLKIG